MRTIARTPRSYTAKPPPMGMHADQHAASDTASVTRPCDNARFAQTASPHHRMALKSTIYKVDLQIADMDRHYYGNHALTVARHPSENDERMMVRVLAFARHASEALAFTRGLSEPDEPELWQRDLTEAIELWIDLGNPDETRIRKACNRAEQVAVYTYSGNASRVWWQQIDTKVARFGNLSVYEVAPDTVAALAALVERTMRLQVTIQDGDIWVANDTDNIHVQIDTLKEAQAA